MRWQEQNGWSRVFAGTPGRIPQLSPFWLTTQISLAASADAETSVTGSGTAIVTPEAEFFILGGITGGWAPGGGPANEGLGDVPSQSPDMYPATVAIREGSGGRAISAGACSIGHLFGGGPRPYLWPAPWRISPGTELQFTLEHRFTTAQDVWLTLFGFKRSLDDPHFPVDFLIDPRLVRILAKYRASGRMVSPEPYFYPLSYAGREGRAPRATETRTFSVTEADFALVHLAGAVTDPDTGESWSMANGLDNNLHQDTSATTPGLGVAQETVRLVTGLGRSRLDDRPVALGALFGTGRNIGRYAVPVLIPRGDSLTALLNFRDVSAGGAGRLPLRCDLTFGGVRLVES
jgi:hypothetical protein